MRPILIDAGEGTVTGRGGRIIGLLLLVPALIALIASYLGPTLATISLSTKQVPLLPTDGSTGVGGRNYDRAGDQIGAEIGFSLLLVVLPLLTVLVIAPVLAYLAHRAGRAGRWTVRLALVVPMVSVTPAALAAGWLFDRRGDFTSASAARGSMLTAVWLTTVGLVCGLAVTAYLAALRRREPGQRTWTPMLVVAAVGALATVAAGLQIFTYVWVLTRGGPADSTDTPSAAIFSAVFLRFNGGVGAATATIILAILAVLGLAAVAVVVFTGLRIEVDPGSRTLDEPAGWSGARVAAAVAGGVVLLIVLGLSLYGLWPWLHRIGNTEASGVPTGDLTVNTWVPPLVSTVVSVLIAAIAAVGIGALRPLGRWSELLLLPFAPWLFVATDPLVLVRYRDAAQDGAINTFGGLIPPVWLSVPGLVVFTLLAAGLRRRWDEPGGRRGRVLLAGLPMLLLVGAATWLAQAQDLVWHYAMATDAEYLTGPAAVALDPSADFLGSPGAADPSVGPPLGLALPIAVLILLILGLAALQVTYLDRVALRAGRAARR